MIPCPDETAEEIALAEYCSARGLVHWHVPQETFTTSWKQKKKNKEMGVREGVSDHWIILPTCKKTLLVVIELKRKHGNTPTDAQIQFLEDLDRVDNVVTVCCYGADEAIDMIEELEKYQTTMLDLCNDRMLRIKANRKKRQKQQKTAKISKNIVKSEKNNLPY